MSKSKNLLRRFIAKERNLEPYRSLSALLIALVVGLLLLVIMAAVRPVQAQSVPVMKPVTALKAIQPSRLS